MSLYLKQIKPNPKGKDLGPATTSQQLAAEWLDIQNTSDSTVTLNGFSLWHLVYNFAHPNGEFEKIMDFTGNLTPGAIMRVHSGGRASMLDMRIEDYLGSSLHVCTGQSYAWNNDRPDTALLTYNQNGVLSTQDRAGYIGAPLEGRVLIRSGNLFVQY